MEGRATLTEEEQALIDNLKQGMQEVIQELVERGVRPANIQIELEWHIKKLLKGE